MQIIANIDFLCIFQQIDNVLEYLTSGGHDNAFFKVTPKAISLAEITLLVSMETSSNDNADKI